MQLLSSVLVDVTQEACDGLVLLLVLLILLLLLLLPFSFSLQGWRADPHDQWYARPRLTS